MNTKSVIAGLYTAPPAHGPTTARLGKAEIGRAMCDEAVQLDERARVDQHVEALPRRHLALLVLRLHPLRAAALLGFSAFALQLFEFVLDGHRGRIYTSMPLRLWLRSLYRSRFVLGEPGRGQHDPMVNRIDLQHLQLDRLPFLHRVGGIAEVGDPELRHRHEAFDVVANADPYAL